AAEALVADQQRRGATVADLPEAGITAAIGAIPFLPPDGVRALGESLGEGYAAMPTAERARLEGLLRRVRSGVAAPDEVGAAVSRLARARERAPPGPGAGWRSASEAALVATPGMRPEGARRAPLPQAAAAPRAMPMAPAAPVARAEARDARVPGGRGEGR